MYKIRQNTLLVSLVIIGVVALVLTVSVYSWLFLKVHSTIAQVALASEEVQLLATKSAHTQTVRRIVRDTQGLRKELDTYFVTEEEIVEFLEDIEDLGVHAGTFISVESVSVGNTIDKDDLVAPLLLSLKSEGTLQEIFYTLALLEAFPKVLTVEGARLTQNPTNLSWQGVFDVVVIKIASVDKK